MGKRKMSDYCPQCFEKLDALHICDTKSSGSRSGFSSTGSEVWGINQSIGNFVVYAPFAGTILDFVLPLPSSLLHSILVSILGSALASMIWVAFKYEGQKSFKFFISNAKNFIYTPNLLKIFGTSGGSKTTRNWFGVIAASTILQILIFTPGNSTYLAHQVNKKIKDASSVNLQVSCPKTRLYLYSDQIECRVRTGILGITVPARAKLSPLFGSSDIKVSLF